MTAAGNSDGSTGAENPFAAGKEMLVIMPVQLLFQLLMGMLVLGIFVLPGIPLVHLLLLLLLQLIMEMLVQLGLLS